MFDFISGLMYRFLIENWSTSRGFNLDVSAEIMSQGAYGG